MAGLRIFVSSTCYDLSTIRGQLRVFIQSLGHEPIMSDFNDVLYDPRVHTHTSCVDEVAGVDVVVLLIGSRYGGKSVPEALLRIDFDALASESQSVEALKELENISVTQLEILKAIENGIPVFTFIDERVWNDHALYEKNKDKDILPDITFPSIDKAETASYIFEFINFLRHRTRGNSVHSFSKLQDIEDTLRAQWSALFQRLLSEQRARVNEARRIDLLSEQFEDLKTAILTSIGSSNEREVARGVVRFRRLNDFLRSLGLQDHNVVLRENIPWEELLHVAGIEQIVDSNELPFELSQDRNFGRHRTFLVKEDDTFYEMRFSRDMLNQIQMDWDAFVQIPTESRTVILDALGDMRMGPGLVRYSGESFDRFLHEQQYKVREKGTSSD